ncbi:MAG TPA: hypothetical protein GX396_00180 [Tissierellia bacterium]|nr:hypothetical protein [Tissierellia bacterium]
MWLEYIVLFSVAIMFFSITVMLTVETVHTTNSISRKRNRKENRRS